MTSLGLRTVLLGVVAFGIPAASAQDAPAVLLTITSPAPGTVVSPGQTVVLTVAAIGNASITYVAVVGEDPFGLSATSTTVPAQFSFTVPSRIASRPFDFTATGATVTGAPVRSAPIEIDVERPDLPRTLSTLLPSLTLGVTGERSPVVVTGTFPDDSVVDVTRSSHVTYQVADQNIATVDAEGVVTAVRPGSTSLTATYTLGAQTVRATLPVIVKSQALSPSGVAMAFGEQSVGRESAPQTLTITNTAAGPVRIFGISASNEFVQTNDCPVDTRLAPSASCVVSVVFSPATIGARIGVLEIAGSAHVVPAVIPLAGTGVPVPDDAVAPVTTTALAPPPIAGGWNNADVTVTLTAADGGAGATGVDHLTYSAAGAQTLPSTTTTSDTASATITAEGATTVSYFATDRAGNIESPKSVTVKLDKTAPAFACGSADALWHAADVGIACTASDGLSGLLNAGDATFAISTTVPAGTETAAAQTGSYRVCDVAGNCAVAGPITGIKIDKAAPAIAITAPAGDTTYLVNQIVTTSYGCTDGGAGTASCSGPVAAGGPLDTATVGAKAFTVTAIDNAGNMNARTTPYAVRYSTASCLGEPGHQILPPIKADGTSVVKQGSTVPAKFRVCDGNGVAVGTAGLVSSFRIVSSQTGNVTQSVDLPVASTTPDTTFRWDPAARQWIFNVSTRDLTPETTYGYRITLNDGTAISFSVTVR